MATIAEALALALQHHQAGRLAEAEQVYRLVLQVEPGEANALAMLGVVCHQKGRHEEAVGWLKKAVAIWPHVPIFHSNLGAVCAALGRWEEAAASYTEVVRQRPQSAPDRNSLGNALMQLGRLEEAEATFREALRLAPQYPEALCDLGTTLANQGRGDEAIASFRQALRVKPDLAPAHQQLGWALMTRGSHDEALTCFEQALRLRPGDALILNSLASIYREQGQLDEAIAVYRQAVAARPDLPVLHSNLLLALHFHPAFDPAVLLKEHLSWANKFGGSASRPQLPSGQREAGRRLRVGYVSAEFRDDGVGRHLAAVIAAHDHAQVEVFCYANLGFADALTERIKAAADHWRPILGLSDARAAELIRADRIDLLVDLAGHAGNNRLPLFTLRPAPIQVTHFVYMSTTGLACIDYRITDGYSDPPGQTELFHTEKLIRLPRTQWCYVPPASAAKSELPARQAGHVTFGSFNILAKIPDEMIGLWCQIMSGLPGSRMLLVTGGGSRGDDRLRATFSKHGVDRERLMLLERVSPEAYYRLYHRVDICLDTFPYTGCFTTADALWMGVPVVSRAGEAWFRRQGVPILALVDLEDLIAETPAAYVEKAVRLARDLPRLEQLRAQLRDRMARSPLTDAPRLARDLEAAYRAMWVTFCQEGG